MFGFKAILTNEFVSISPEYASIIPFTADVNLFDVPYNGPILIPYDSIRSMASIYALSALNPGNCSERISSNPGIGIFIDLFRVAVIVCKTALNISVQLAIFVSKTFVKILINI